MLNKKHTFVTAIITSIFLSITPSVFAAPLENGENSEMAKIRSIIPGQIEKTDIKGVYEVIVKNQNKSVFATFPDENSRYLFFGSIFDLQEGQQLEGKAAQKLKVSDLKRKKALINTIKDKDKIIFAAPVEKYYLDVFTDVDCPFCQKLHGEVGKLNKLGITVKYIASPLAALHPAAQSVMEKIWCSKDRAKAMDDYKKYKIAPTSTSCENPVAAQLAIAQQLGVNGTPAVFLKNGSQPGGYMPAERLLKVINLTLPASQKLK